MSVDYPATLFTMGEAPPDNAGRGFEAKDGARFFVYSSANALDQDLEALLADTLEGVSADAVKEKNIAADGFTVVFDRDGETCVYTGSADLMPRNLYNRVELVIPVRDEGVRQEMLEILDLSLADNAGAWTLDAEGEWTRRTRAPGEPLRDVQATMIERSTTRAAESPQTF